MDNLNVPPLSRRQLIMSAGMGVATAAIFPVLLFGQAKKKGIVPTMIDAAARRSGRRRRSGRS